MNLADYLSQPRNQRDSKEPSKPSDEALLTEYYTKWKGENSKEPTGGHGIPRFYTRPPADDQVLLQKLREEARTSYLQRKNSQLMSNEELQKLWTLLEKYHSPPDVGDELMISYKDYKKIKDEMDEKCSSFFTASTFAKLLRNDPYGRVSIMQIFNYIMKKEWLQQTRISLSLFDVQGLGYLKESDLENYILELIPTLPQLNCLEESFHSFYVCTAVRKFFFFLDPLRTGRVKIQDILACGFLDDLLELRDEDLPKEAQEANWFSAPSSLRVYGQYLSLDTDHNGMLNKEELMRYGTSTLTIAFVDRIFQECLTYDGEVDYKTYLDFVLAMENKKEPQAIQYFFRLLDIEGHGYLTAFSLQYFFRAIQKMMERHQQEPVNFADIKDEIFDMVKPKDPLRINYQDLVSSGQGETVINILTDLNGFWTYENRELMLAENQNTSENT
ncbi:serine/threonine-protein phosphatase 2A regulatory subunit B'' subunit gamma-like isoform X2 [Dysidea avara]|uniref:serine/threonine-protein phosphatase 2A regulatory subunit B'' subunit gamma-like isoform X2 n=1 Tax=Dysidea avara TaxID=196820 RepID=UPI00332A58CB